MVRLPDGTLDLDGDTAGDRDLLRLLSVTTGPVRWPELVSRAGYQGIDLYIAASRPATP